MLKTMIQHAENLAVPEWVRDFDSFHRWTESDEFPEYGRFDLIQGELWIDMSEVQVFYHNQVKAEFFRVLLDMARVGGQGIFFPDGLRVSHPEFKLSAVPDGAYVLNHSLETMRIRPVEGAKRGYVRFEGAPDMVLEVVSDKSVPKDTDRLMQTYWDSGVTEYWLVDARKEPLSFTIHRRTARGFVAVRKQSGWIKSAVFDKVFRFSQTTSALGYPRYTLDVR